MNDHPVGASFRDPSGFLFRRDGRLLRQVQASYAEDYDRLLGGGLYEELTGARLLVPHLELDGEPASRGDAYRILEPEPIRFISYPYEWCFSQLQDAALCTLEIQQRALAKDLILKDASAYNIQFHRGRPLLIDTLSFARYVEGEPWVAYRQFCQHFLAPLALMAYRDVRLSSLFRTHIDGIPLDLASRLLPWHSRLKPGLFLHVHAHAASQKRHESRGAGAQRKSLSKRALLGIIDSLRSAIRSLRWQPGTTEWADYYSDTNYTDASARAKQDGVGEFLAASGAQSVWDLGANDGSFSRIASSRQVFTVAADVDPSAVELNYRRARDEGDEQLLPLLIDLTNPSPALGWAHRERDALVERGPADCVLALALIHHLAISNNVPLERLANFFARCGRQLIVEFVPKEDSQVQRLLATREDVFPNYTRGGFETAFSTTFELLDTRPIPESARTLYWMRRVGNSPLT